MCSPRAPTIAVTASMSFCCARERSTASISNRPPPSAEKAMDGGAAVFSKSSDFAAAFERLGLNEEAAQIAAQVDGKRSASDIANMSGKDVFNVYKLLEALRALGLLTKAQVKDEFAFHP